MTSPFKNRLVGIIILVALVVIFLPSLIDGKKTAYHEEFAAVPINPDVEPHTNPFVEQEINVDESLPEKAILNENETVSDWQVEEIVGTTSTDINPPIKTIEVEKSDAEIDKVKADKVKAKADKVKADKVKANKAKADKVKADKVKADKVLQQKSASSDPAWAIQLGAFQNKANINSLIKKLREAGFQVYTHPKNIVDGQLTRVFVGPNPSKTKLEVKLPELKRLTNLNGKLVIFN